MRDYITATVAFNSHQLGCNSYNDSPLTIG